MDDLISRQAAIEVVDAVWSVTGDKNVAKVWDQIKDLPSAQPERKKGKWIKEGEQMLINLETAREQYKRLGYPHRTEEKLKCSVCRMVTLVDSGIKYEYCPHCGADMRGES